MLLFHSRLAAKNVESIFSFGLIWLNTFLNIASLSQGSCSVGDGWCVIVFLAKHFLLNRFQLSHSLFVFGDFVASISKEVSVDFANVFDFTWSI